MQQWMQIQIENEIGWFLYYNFYRFITHRHRTDELLSFRWIMYLRQYFNCHRWPCPPSAGLLRFFCIGKCHWASIRKNINDFDPNIDSDLMDSIDKESDNIPLRLYEINIFIMFSRHHFTDAWEIKVYYAALKEFSRIWMLDVVDYLGSCPMRLS